MNVPALAQVAASALITLPAAVDAQIGVIPKGEVRLDESKDQKFQVGDIWEYKTRPGEERSRITILRIENSPKVGIIVHVAVDNLTWLDCENKAFAQSIPHMPFGRARLKPALPSALPRLVTCQTSRKGTGYGATLSPNNTQVSVSFR